MYCAIRVIKEECPSIVTLSDAGVIQLGYGGRKCILAITESRETFNEIMTAESSAALTKSLSGVMWDSREKSIPVLRPLLKVLNKVRSESNYFELPEYNRKEVLALLN